MAVHIIYSCGLVATAFLFYVAGNHSGWMDGYEDGTAGRAVRDMVESDHSPTVPTSTDSENG